MPYRCTTALGVVTGIACSAVFAVEIKGRANYAGITPMSSRHNSAVSASRRPWRSGGRPNAPVLPRND